MKGGYQILDLSSITLVKDTETTITDLNILDQLLGLTDFLNKNGLIDKQLKPIYVITKDSAGFVSITNPEANKLLIDGFISGKHIQLNIAYTSSLDDYGNTVYVVSSAKYLYNAVLEFEDIVDKDGHNRFIEGDIELVENIPDGFTKTYGKWSLSGTHLLIVLGLTLADTTVITTGTNICFVELPQWVIDKIYPLWANSYIETKVFTMRANDWSSQNLGVNFLKNAQGKIMLVVGSSITLTAERFVRINFDLLIDDE